MYIMIIRPFVMLREQIDWCTVWSLRPSSMDGGGGGRSRSSTSQLPEHRRYVYVTILYVHTYVTRSDKTCLIAITVVS